MTWREARQALDLPSDFDCHTQEDAATAMRGAVDRIVEARRIGDDGKAAYFSQVKQAVKGRGCRLCPTCGNGKAPHARECRLCALRRRHYNNMISPKSNGTLEEWKIEDNIPIPPKTRGSLLAENLAKLKIGQSFPTRSSRAAVASATKRLKIRTTYRYIKDVPGVKDKEWIRVWRVPDEPVTLTRKP